MTSKCYAYMFFFQTVMAGMEVRVHVVLTFCVMSPCVCNQTSSSPFATQCHVTRSHYCIAQALKPLLHHVPILHVKRQ